MKLYKTLNIPNPRIDVADALRGIAVAGIILYHSVEHFNTLDAVPEYSFAFDDKLFETPGIILAGKMYSIFAILFGLGLWAKTGTQYSLLIGAGIVIVQYLILKGWSRTHQRGPLESLWRKLTWMVPYGKK